VLRRRGGIDWEKDLGGRIEGGGLGGRAAHIASGRRSIKKGPLPLTRRREKGLSKANPEREEA